MHVPVPVVDFENDLSPRGAREAAEVGPVDVNPLRVAAIVSIVVVAPPATLATGVVVAAALETVGVLRVWLRLWAALAVQPDAVN